MLCTSKLQTGYKVVISILVGVIVIGGIIALAWKYFESFSEMSQVVNKNPIQQQAVDLAQLSDNYQAQSNKAMAEFFSADLSDNAVVASFAAQTQQKLLALSLPAQYRQKHLSEVLLLGEISDLAAAGQSAKVSAKLAELKEVVAK